MEPKECPKAPQLRQKGIQSEQSKTQSGAKPSEWSQKVNHRDQNGAQSELTENMKWLLEASVGFLWIRDSYFWALREQIPSTIASKIDAKINAGKVIEMNAKMHEKYAQIDGESVKIHWKYIEKSMFLHDLQNLVFCDTSAVKTWFCMYSNGEKSINNLKKRGNIYARNSCAQMMWK